LRAFNLKSNFKEIKIESYLQDFYKRAVNSLGRFFITTKRSDKTSDLKFISGPVLFVTDVHVRSPHEPNYKALLYLIRKIDITTVEYFVLLGDIFDFFFGYSRFFCAKFHELFEALEDLATKGVRVIFVQGNHEFSLEKRPWKNVQLVLEGTLVIQLKNGTKIALCHGDYLLGKKQYALYMKIVRSSVFQNLTRLLPAFLVDQICLKLAEVSRKKKRVLNRDRLKEKALKWISSTDASLGFMGHFHLSLECEFETSLGSQKVVFVNAWRKPHATVLGLDNKVCSIPIFSTPSSTKLTKNSKDL
jgi:UDP-2,3-diacylglucosamine hydrolase